MGFPAVKPATYEDLSELPENLLGEIIGGRLITHRRPAPKHTVAYSALGGEIWGTFDRGGSRPGGCWILDEPELHLAADILVATLAGSADVSQPPFEAFSSGLAGLWVG